MAAETSKGETLITVHPWHWSDGAQHYSDSGDPVDGWTAYTRVPRADGAWNGVELGDFPDRAGAVRAAQADAAARGLPPSAVVIEA